MAVPNVHNFRSLGWHSVPNGQRTRNDLVYRSAETSAITPEGVAEVHKLGIRTVYDLRSKTEFGRQEKPTFDGIPETECVRIPVFGDVVLSPEELAQVIVRDYGDANGSEGFVRAYAGILDAGTQHGAYRRVFEHVLRRPRDPFLVHCSAGKDRTGIICALMLSLAGVRDEHVAREYALTTEGLSNWLPAVAAKMMGNPAFNQDEALIQRALSSDKAHMLGFLDHVRAQWGSVAGYMEKGLGFSPEEIEKIRRNLTDECLEEQ